MFQSMKEFPRYTLPRKDYGPAIAKFYEIEFSDLLTKLDAGEFTGDEVLHAIVAVGKRCPSKLVLQAKETIAKYLDDSDDCVRGEAVFCLGLSWGLDEYAGKMASLLSEDPNEDIRSRAAHCLGVFFKASKDANTLGHLARVVQNEEECISVRSSAYGAILMILDPTQEREISRHITSAKLRPDVNWELVRHLSR